MKYKVTFAIILLLLFTSELSGTEEKPFKEDVYEVSSVLLHILSNYTTMNFDKITNYTDGKAKKDIENLLLQSQTPTSYKQIKQEISLLSLPEIKDIQIFENNLAVATVEWKVKRSIPKGNSNEEVTVRREIIYLFKKTDNQWKLISYR